LLERAATSNALALAITSPLTTASITLSLFASRATISCL